HVCIAQVVRGDAAAVISTANELLTLSEEHGFSQPHAFGLAYLGWAAGQTGDASKGIRYLEEGLAAWNQLGGRSHLCLTICLLAETYFAGAQYNKGMEQANSAIALSSEIGDKWSLPRSHMIRARLLQQTCANNRAIEESLRTAIEVAQLLGAK